jgi:hypothetical protein
MELVLYAVTKAVHLIKENIEFDLKKHQKYLERMRSIPSPLGGGGNASLSGCGN